MIGKWDRDRWIGAAVAPTTGANEYAIAELKNDVVGCGLAEVLVRSDCPCGLKEVAATALKLAGVTVMTEESALHDSQCNGLVESAVKDVKDAARTNLACLVRRFGQEFTGEHPCLDLNRCRRGADGKTAYELRKGRKFERGLLHFAEKIPSS